MLNTHFTNLVRAYVPTIEQLTGCYAFVVPYNEDGIFGIDIELTSGADSKEVYSLEFTDGEIKMCTNANLYSYHTKVMNDIAEAIQEKIYSKTFTRADYFERNGLSGKLDEEGWKKVEGLVFTEEEKAKKPRIYFDMDGVLAVFNKNATMEEVFTPGYFRGLEPIPEMVKFVKELIENGYDVNILSGACFTAIQEKIEWLQEHMPFISPEKLTFVPVDADKSKFIPDAEHSVLIDDYNKNLDEWRGLAIKCKTDINSYNPKYASVDLKSFNNLSRLESAIDKWDPKQRLPITDFITLTHPTEEGDKRPLIVCNDGFKFFIGTGKDHYAEPQSERMHGSDYTSVEVMYPSSEDKTLSAFAKEYLFLSNSIIYSTIPYVTIDMLNEIVEAHKGISAKDTFGAYEIEHYGIAEKYFAGTLEGEISENGLDALAFLDDKEYDKEDRYGIASAFNYTLISLGDIVPDFIAEQANTGIREMKAVLAGDGDYDKASKCIENVIDFVKHEQSAATAYLCEIFEERLSKAVEQIKEQHIERE